MWLNNPVALIAQTRTVQTAQMGNAGTTSNILASARSHFRSSDLAPLCMLSLCNKQMLGGETFTPWQGGGREPTSQRVAECVKCVFQLSSLSESALPPSTMHCVFLLQMLGTVTCQKSLAHSSKKSMRHRLGLHQQPEPAPFQALATLSKDSSATWREKEVTLMITS